MFFNITNLYVRKQKTTLSKNTKSFQTCLHVGFLRGKQTCFNSKYDSHYIRCCSGLQYNQIEYIQSHDTLLPVCVPNIIILYLGTLSRFISRKYLMVLQSLSYLLKTPIKYQINELGEFYTLCNSQQNKQHTCSTLKQ